LRFDRKRLYCDNSLKDSARKADATRIGTHDLPMVLGAFCSTP
jgi:hypothetical protein